MPDRRREVKTYMVDKICPKCEIGIMQCDHTIALATYPPRYMHRCPNCGWMETYATAYPRIEYTEIEDG